MKNRFKKLLALVLVGVMALQLVGCSSEEETTSSSANEAGSAATGTDGSATGQEPRKVTIWVQNHSSNLGSYDEVWAYQELEKDLNVDIEWIHPSSESIKEQFNLMLVSGDLPDIICYSIEKDYVGGLEKAYEDKVIMDLTDVLETKIPNYAALSVDLQQELRTIDGKILTLNGLKESSYLNGYFGYQIRQDWLDKLGLEAPTNMEEWYNVLTAFKTQDPNGNGEADEIPLTTKKNAYDSVYSFATAYGVINDFMVKDGQIMYGPIQPEFKEFVLEMNKWYEEGLLDQDFIVNDENSVTEKMVNSIAGSFCGYGSRLSRYALAAEALGNTEYEQVPVQWPEGEDGMSYTAHSKYNSLLSNELVITTQAEDLEACYEVLNYFYSEEGLNNANWGQEGLTYEVVDGQKQYTDFVLNNPEGKTYNEVLENYGTPLWGIFKVMTEEAFIARSTEVQINAADVWADHDASLFLPTSMKLMSDESKEVDAIELEIATYKDEMLSRMIIGDISIEDTWDDYVKAIESLNVELAVTKLQEAYDRAQ